jgi:hypothetical protein
MIASLSHFWDFFEISKKKTLIFPIAVEPNDV